MHRANGGKRELALLLVHEAGVAPARAVAVAVLLELGPELDEHGGADDDGADDDGVRDHGAVDHRHLGHEPRLDELDDNGQGICAVSYTHLTLPTN